MSLKINPMLKRIFLFAWWCSVFSLIQAQNPAKMTIQSGGHTREYLLYTPENQKNNHPAGLIICLHGFNRTMEDFFNNYNIAGIADLLNMIVLAPQALPEQDQEVIKTAKNLKSLGYDIPLDAAWGCGLRVKASLIGITLMNETLNKQVDDAAFIDAMITATLSNYPDLPSNRFIFGTSMGGFMSYQYAMKYGNSLSGLISVCGSMGKAIDYAGNNTRLPICDFHSTTDEVVPYSGSFSSSGIDISISQSKTSVINYWVSNNLATTAPIEEDIHYYPSANGITVKKLTHTHPRWEVIHYRINGAGHSYYFKKEQGDCMDYNEEIYKFIASHTTGTATNLENPEKEPVRLYPNPATDIVYLSVQEGNVTIYDPNGMRVMTRTFQSGNLDISSLKKGMYIIHIESGQSRSTHKLIKL